jgi:signal transduction histidine kinase
VRIHTDGFRNLSLLANPRSSEEYHIRVERSALRWKQKAAAHAGLPVSGRPVHNAVRRIRDAYFACATVCLAAESLISFGAMSLSKALHKQPMPLLFIEALILVALIGILDSLGGWDVSMFLFYAVPILFVAWFGNGRLAILCALACGIAWYVAKLDTHPYGTPHAYAWAAFNRVVYFLFVAVGGTAFKRLREEFRARMEALMRARELEQEIVRVSEREQMRIGQDLHDGLCQNLVAIDCAAACLKSDLEAKALLPEAETAEAIQKLLREAVVEARDLARGIFPVQMDAEGLPAALEELVAKTNRLPQVTVTSQVEGEMGIEDPQVSMHLYRIAQQALNNALSHARASRISVRLKREGARVTMTVADDGCGFAQPNSPSRGMGLRTMNYRARLIGAELIVESTPNVGTEIRCTLTLPHGRNN